MHNNFMRFLPLLSLLILTPIVQAQPPEPVREGPKKLTPQQEILDNLKGYAAGLNSENPYFGAAYFVADAPLGYYGGPEWGEVWSKQRGTAKLKIEKADVKELQESDAKVKVLYRWETPLFRSEALQEELTLHRTADQGRTRGVWQIVVPPADEIQELLKKVPADATPFLLYTAGQIKTPQTNDDNEFQVKAISNLKQLGLGVLQFCQDYDEVYAFYPQYAEKALRPYLKNDELWKVPGTDVKFSFNVNLCRQNLAALRSPAETVTFFEGEAEKPIFRYNGKAAIGFADGHVKLVTAEEAGKLIWKL